MSSVLLVHYDEIALKGDNRIYFEKKLLEQMVYVLRSFEKTRVKREYGRFIVIMDDSIDRSMVTVALKRVPGVYSISLAHIIERDFEAMKLASRFFEAIFVAGNNFRVDVKRSDKNFPYTSMMCEREIGAYILSMHEHLKVKLKNQELTIMYEITHKEVYVYMNKIYGIGGLPVGSTGTVVSLLSGGIDSPVASYLMNKRGARVIYIHFRNHTADGSFVKDKILSLIKVLSLFQCKSVLYTISFEEIQKQIIGSIPAEYRMIAYRRCMVRIANMIAERVQAGALVTGDSLGQVASQTLQNLNVVHEVSDRAILSPLIGMNKTEIVSIAREIGTLAISELAYDDCCSFFIAEHPNTAVKSEVISALEKRIPIEALMTSATSNMEIFEFDAYENR